MEHDVIRCTYPPNFLSCSKTLYHAPTYSSVFWEILLTCWEHKKKLWSMITYFWFVLPIYYDAPKIFIMLPCFGKFWVVFWAHSNTNGSITSFLTSRSHLFIMLQIKFSCSHIFMRFDAKFWEHEKKIGSIIKMWEHHINICIMLPEFLSCSHVLGGFWSKSPQYLGA